MLNAPKSVRSSGPIGARELTDAATYALHASQLRSPFGHSVREFWPIYIGFLCKSVLPTGPMREANLRQAQMLHTCPGACDSPLRDSPPAPQEQSFALTRRRHSKRSPFGHSVREFSPIWGSFAQDSHVKCAEIRALLWAYRRPRAHRCGNIRATCLPAPALHISGYEYQTSTFL
jgi:hypothetical protein